MTKKYAPDGIHFSLLFFHKPTFIKGSKINFILTINLIHPIYVNMNIRIHSSFASNWTVFNNTYTHKLACLGILVSMHKNDSPVGYCLCDRLE